MSALPFVEKPFAPGKALLTADAAAEIVENFIADHLGNLVLAGIPRRMFFPLRVLWAVPIMLGYPGYGLAGIIGVVAVDDEFASIVASTPIDEMRKAAEQLFLDHQTEIEAAFQKASSASG